MDGSNQPIFIGNVFKDAAVNDVPGLFIQHNRFVDIKYIISILSSFIVKDDALRNQ